MLKSCFCVALVLLALSSRAQGEVLNLTVKDAVKMAIERNLELRTELYNAAIARADVRKNRGIYDPLLALTVNYQDSNTFPAIIGSTGNQKTLQLNPAVTQLIPTGATVGIQFNNSRVETDYTFSVFPDYWQSQLALTVSQPLLRNFGPEITNVNITLAEQAKEGALKRFAAKLLTIVGQIRVEYFKLSSFRQDLESKKVSLELARRILTDTGERVKAGTLPSMELLNAEYGVSLREKELIDAEKALRDQVDLLRQVLQIPTSADINAVEAMNLEKVTPDENEATRKALSLRPEIEEANIQVASANLSRRAARNKTLPSLNLNGSFALTGLGDTYDRNLDRLSSTDYPIWNLGIQFEYPFGNDAAEGEYEKSKLRYDQAQTQLESLTTQVATDVRAAVRSVDASFKQLDVAARGKAFAEERLSAYVAKNEVGLATTKDVLDVENDLAAARTNQIKAEVTYVVSVTQLLQATGQLLEQEGITVNGKKIEQLLGVRDYSRSK